MAVPIPIKPDTPESTEEIRAKLEEARIHHAQAVVAAYKLLQELHDAGVLDIVRGGLAAGDAIVTKLAVASEAPEAVNAVRNLVSLGRILGTIDPDLLHRLADELTAQKNQPMRPGGLWSALRGIMGRDGRRALAGSAAFLMAFGRALAKPSQIA
jgi:uncharacterized protein YjgD (DUF1641 family)